MRQAAVLMVLIISLAGFLNAQSTNASITGYVTDSTKAVLPDARVTVINTGTGVRYDASTNKFGSYTVPNLSPGNYRVEVEKTGFRTVVKSDVVLHVQDAVAINFDMMVGSTSEIVTVTAGAPLVNTQNASVSTIVDQTFVKNMPLNGRSFQDLILLTPGTVTETSQIDPRTGSTGVGKTGEFSVNGQRTEENYYTVDGVSANVGTAPGYLRSGVSATETALGTTQSLASIDEMQEFRVQTSTYSAEYGRTPGAQIAIETKSGTNSYHGTASEYLRNDYFDASDYFTDYFRALNPNANPPIRKNAVRQNDFGGTFGGPLTIPHVINGRDKTFFFVSYEGLRLLQPQPAHTIPVPDNALRNAPSLAGTPLQQVLNSFPLQSPGGFDDTANGDAQFIGTWSNPSSLNTASFRVDHILKNNTRLFFRLSNTGSYNTLRGVNEASVNTTSSSTARSYTGGAMSAFTSHLTNEFRVNYTTNETPAIDTIDRFGGAVPVNLGQLSGYGPNANFDAYFVLGGQFIGIGEQQSTTRQKQWNLVDTVGVSLGKHQLRFGADYRRFTPFALGGVSASIFYLDESEVTSNDAAFGGAGPYADANALVTNYSFFVEDSWRVTSHLNLSTGLRWEVNPPFGVTKGQLPYTLRGTDPSNYTLAQRGTPLWYTTWGNFAPRLGLAYTVHNPAGQETVLRGGGGLFYDTGQQAGLGAFTNGLGTSAFTNVNGTDFGGPPLPFPSGLPPVPPIVNPPTFANGGLPSFFVYYVYPHLQLPYTVHWNASIEQSLGKSQTITMSYVGSHAGRLIQDTNVHPTNPIVIPGGYLFMVLNGLTSDYNSLQAQFQRRLSHGLTALASYTWSHCLDYGSFNFDIGYERGNCDMDVRHNLSGAFSWDLPRLQRGFLGGVFSNWGLDDRILARTGFPVGLSGPSTYNPVTGQQLGAGIDFVPGQPLYIHGANCQAVYSSIESGIASEAAGMPVTVTAPPCPSGRAINPDAFITTASGGLGNVPRNFVRALGVWQMNVAVRREFPIYENLKLQFRAEAFNVFNHPNFGTVDSNCGTRDPLVGPGCTNVTFGQPQFTLANSLGGLASLYQMGGSRSMQFALKLIF